jgi:hypothetical protein
MATDERKSPPTLILLILTLLGLYSIPKVMSPGPGESPRSASGDAPPNMGDAAPARAGGKSEGRSGTGGGADVDLQVLAPLLTYLDDGTASGAEDLAAIQARLRSRHGCGARCLIATVPDPHQSTNSYWFDDNLKAILRAVESRHFLLANYRIPPPAEAPRPGEASKEKPMSAPEAQAESQPGLFVFRCADPAESRQEPLLLVFLVPETPTLGIDKQAMYQSLRLARVLDERDHGGTPRLPKAFNILGPQFSGSQLSLQQVLERWLGESPANCGRFRVISTASAIAREDLVRAIARYPGAELSFAATDHSIAALNAVMLEYLASHGGASGRIALLSESNTGYGQRQRVDRLAGVDARITTYPFPSNIAALRAQYQKLGLLSDTESRSLRSSDQLRVPLDDAGPHRDVVPDQTPELTATLGELTLDQILTDINRNDDIRAVGIIATDPRDVIFLAVQVRRFCRDVQIFTIGAELLYTQSQFIGDLLGMLVASTYPLYGHNQSWSYSYQGANAHLFFSSNGSLAIYNAAIAQLFDLRIDGVPGARGRPDPPRFLEYGLPFRKVDGACKPAIWISVVGHRGLYPVQVRYPDRDAPEDYRDSYNHYVYGHALDPEELSDWETRKVDLFRPLYHNLWEKVFLSLSGACLLMALLTYEHLWCAWTRDRRAGSATGSVRRLFNFGRLPEYLNWGRAGDPADLHPFRGPGMYLCLALGLLLAVYVVVTWPMFAALTHTSWHHDDREFWYVAIAFGSVLVLGTSLTVALVSLLPARLPDPADPAPAPGADAAGARPAAEGRVRGVALRDRSWTFLVSTRGGVVGLGSWLVGFLVSVTVLLAVSHGRGLLAVPRGIDVENTLAFERGMILPGGVSPLFPVLFVGVAAAAWIYTQLRRRHLITEYTVDNPPVPEVAPGQRPAVVALLYQCRQARAEIQELFERPLLAFRRVDSLFPLLILLLDGFFLVPVLSRLSWSPEHWTFDVVFWALFVALFLLLTFQGFLLVVLWNELGGFLRLLARTDLLRAFDRLPPMLARWFFNASITRDVQMEFVTRQADALAARSTEAVRAGLKASYPEIFGDDDRRWTRLVASLGGDERTSVATGRLLFEILLPVWSRKPITDVMADGKPESPTPSPAPATGTGTGDADTWIEQAENLIALHVMRWLVPAMQHLWTNIAFLVIGALALLLAASSYPFPMQGRLMMGVSMLIVALVVAISNVVLGTNRDELISRISKTNPNRLSLDGPLVKNLVTYVVPLVGVLAAISFDTSDVIRTLFDPILRRFTM